MEIIVIVLTILAIYNRWQIMKLNDKVDLLEMDLFDCTDLTIETGKELQKLDEIVNPNKDFIDGKEK